MSNVAQDPVRREAVAQINARLESVLQEMRKDEAKLLDSLELKRLKRRLAAQDAERK